VIHFISADEQEVSSFLILCRFNILGWGLFARGFWDCDVLEAEDTVPSPMRVELHQYALSGNGNAPFTVSKTLELARGRSRRRGGASRDGDVGKAVHRSRVGPRTHFFS